MRIQIVFRMRLPEDRLLQNTLEVALGSLDGASVTADEPGDPPRDIQSVALGTFDLIIVGVLLPLNLRTLYHLISARVNTERIREF